METLLFVPFIPIVLGLLHAVSSRHPSLMRFLEVSRVVRQWPLSKVAVQSRRLTSSLSPPFFTSRKNV